MREKVSTNKSGGRWVGPFVGILALLLGFALTGFGAKTLYDNWKLSSDGIVVTGNVVGYETYTDGDQQTRYKAVINFQVGGTVYRHVDPSASLNPNYGIGEPINLLYEPDNPRNVTINRTVDLWINPLLPLGAGLFVILIGLGLSMGGKRQRPEQAMRSTEG